MAEEHLGPPDADVDDFLGDEPTRDPARWYTLWRRDLSFPVRSHRGWLGRVVVAVKRLFRPLVTVPQNDLWERQRIFNLILLEWLQGLRDRELEPRVGQLEVWVPDRLQELLHHNDALYARLDQKLDLYRRQARDLAAALGAALAVAESGAVTATGTGSAPSGPEGGAGGDAGAREALGRAHGELRYLELERRFRGTEEEIGQRLAPYLEILRDRGEVLDLGCGRGEALALLEAEGIRARGVDASGGMVEQCRQRGLEAQEGDLFASLAGVPAGSLGAVVSFHVIEHLPAEAVDRLVRLAWRALKGGGVLILETPNPLSVVVAARNFWVDPTHVRPIHPESLALSCRLAGFDPVEQLDLRPFPPAERLPEIDLATVPEAQRPLAHRVNELRDRLDDLLFGDQDYAVVAEKPAP